MADFETKKQHYLDEIGKIAKESFNDEQKQIARFILENATENNIDSIYTFITQRVKTGFVFDAAPEVAHDCIALCERDDTKSFGSPMDNAIHHKLIIGENYDVLKNLVATYTKNGQGLIDVIYIDPPYNTEKTKEDGNDYKSEVESSKFVYRDKFSRTGWLNMMKERLELARKLLSDKGVIFISIDDNEQAYLKVLCDEIFGENNFIGNIMWDKKSGAKGVPPLNMMVNVHEYILAYAKSELFKFKGEKRDADADGFKNPDNDPRGPWRESNIKSTTIPKNKAFTIENPKTGKKYTNTWAFSKETLEKMISENRIIWKPKLPKQKEYMNEMTHESKAIKDTWGVFDAQSTTVFLKKLIPNTKFDNPKPLSLMRYLLGVSTSKRDTILDFFAGSGTTGQAVMELNEEDGGNRQCILVTNNENNIATNVTYERLYRVVNGKGTKGEAFSWKYSEDTPYLTNNYFDVFNTVLYELKIDDYEKSQRLLDKAKQEFKKLNPDYEAGDLDIYNQLASLKPYKK